MVSTLCMQLPDVVRNRLAKQDVSKRVTLKLQGRDIGPQLSIETSAPRCKNRSEYLFPSPKCNMHRAVER